ncbi:MAG: sugar transferase [Bacteroidia bacterium]
MLKEITYQAPNSAEAYFSEFLQLHHPVTFVNYSVVGENALPSEGTEVNNIINFSLVNDIRYINKYFQKVNQKLEQGDYFCGCLETFSAKQSKQNFGKVPILKKALSFFDFVVHRVFPKIKGIKYVYFSVTKGQSRLLSKAEVFGRLVCCGFEIVDYKDIDEIIYFVAKKASEPKEDIKPSYGPIFKMARIGKDGKVFFVYKFRTMHPYSEYLQDFVLQSNGYASSGKPAKDFRLTPWGKFLRRYWLDELPQLLNVMKGEMKLVGVRPVSSRYFQDIPTDLQKLRLTQKPGCIPPYLALGLKSNVHDVQRAEREYLEEKIKKPYSTDFRYFYKALYHIIIKKKRSA